MKITLRPYIQYQQTGSAWMGHIPSHWLVQRNGSLFTQRNETGYGELPILEVSLNTGVRIRNFDDPTRKQIMSNREKYKRAVKGDIAYNMMRLWQGAIGMAPIDGLVSPAYVVANAYSGTISSYFVELYRTDGCKAEINKYSHGIVSDRNRLYWTEFKQMPVCVPPPEEQLAIVNYLNHVDNKIRKLIKIKRQLIELLAEQKQTIISKIVTRGLELTVALKSSGLPWLGEIPVHWDLKRNGQLFTQRNETGFIDLPILEVSLNTGVRVRDFEMGSRKQQMTDRSKYKRARQGDLAYNMMRMWQGAVGVAPVDGLVSPAYVVAHPLDQVDVKYFDALFHTSAYMNEVNNCSRGIVKDRNRLYWQDFKQLLSPHPPLTEQRQIVEHIDALTKELDRAMSRVVLEISLIREYRTRLATDVVTGKLDVRELSRTLPMATPDEMREVEPFDSSLDTDDEELDDDDSEIIPVAAEED